ncbi:regulator of nucleoside diphosphate kinase [Maribacter orientalis]|uniref:Regulator of nucleoside diphosphate kinase n=1 Tax=Maribacter orientalis TaxID=228957 RepID=A0A1H7LFT6_9FLAO|nr:GreA/GreB family elongation factor [Maribacter orientalis]SEK97844.1 regulator of nucleoside diphosphate kinase [Maribacter orientalis]|tara:strand:- start:6862 stop:7344 length:483 start_codon:yes stop_codon:yes gene_type:complete
MKYGSLVFCKKDFVIIKQYLQMDCAMEDYSHKNVLEILETKMSNSIILEEEHLPAEIIQLYSKIIVKCGSKWKETFQIVAPSEENLKRNKVSVISSLGASLIGLSKGDKIQFGLPGSVLSLTVEKVKQLKKKIKIDISEDIIKESLPKGYTNSLTLNKQL